MSKIQIGGSERELSEASESWIIQQVQDRQQDGKSVCVKVTLNGDGVNFVLVTPQCGGGGGGGWQPNSKEQAVIKLWNDRHLNQNDWAVGNLVAFLKQLRKLF